jgi:hypothetical protein
LGLEAPLTKHEDRVINREIAAEWIALADDIIAQSKPIKVRQAAN